MLKISQVEPPQSAVTLRLEGRAVGPWVAELRNSCEQVLGAGLSLILHLADVEFMDSDAAAFVASLHAGGVALVECPPFVAEQLKAAALARNGASGVEVVGITGGLDGT